MISFDAPGTPPSPPRMRPRRTADGQPGHYPRREAGPAISFDALGVRFSLPLLTLLTPLLAQRLGMEGSWGALTLALGAHELSHLIAAKLCGVGVTEIRLMPFGGSARMENPYGLPGRRLAAVAAAGPCANLLLAVFFSALAQWGLLSAPGALALSVPNLLLFLFNMLPALPLDGGRMLFCLLRGLFGEERAQRMGVRLGRLLAILLLAAAAAVRLRGGKWNLSFVLAAVFILTSGRDEKCAMEKSRARRLDELLRGDGEGRPARLYQLDMSVPAARALRLLRPRERGWFVLTRDGRPQGVIDAAAVLRHLMQDGAGDAPLSALPYYAFSPPRE